MGDDEWVMTRQSRDAEWLVYICASGGEIVEVCKNKNNNVFVGEVRLLMIINHAIMHGGAETKDGMGIKERV